MAEKSKKKMCKFNPKNDGRRIIVEKLGLIVILISLFMAMDLDAINIRETIFVIITFLIGISLYLIPQFFVSKKKKGG